LFYFLRSYTVWVARRTGTRSSLKGFARQFLADSSLSSLLERVFKTGEYLTRRVSGEFCS